MSANPRLALTAALAIPASFASAQSGPGLPNTVFPQRELFTAVSTIQPGTKHGQPMMYDGYLVPLQIYPEGRISFYDLSDPYAPGSINSVTGAGAEIHVLSQRNWGGQHGPVATLSERQFRDLVRYRYRSMTLIRQRSNSPSW